MDGLAGQRLCSYDTDFNVTLGPACSCGLQIANVVNLTA